MKWNNKMKTLALAALTVFGTMAMAAPASAACYNYQFKCSYTTSGIRCWFVPTTTAKAPAVKLAPTQTVTTAPAVKPGTTPTATTPAAGLTAAEQQMLDLVNAERAKAGLTPLKADPQLTKLARMKSQDMINRNYFSHQSPTYGSPFDMMKTYGVTYRTAGENIAGNHSVQAAHTALMNSPGHRANILNPNFTHIGIGIQQGGNYGMMFTQMFVGR
jgi:uncharacterized YkwD family protein